MTATTDNLLRKMPVAAEDIPAWFDSLKDAEFDRVCVSAITSLVAEEERAGQFVSVGTIARLTQAMRERYREICGIESLTNIQPLPAGKVVGERCYNSKLNELQVRIARRVVKAVSHAAIAEMFGVTESTLRHARLGRTWAHVKQAQSPLRLSPTSHAA